MASLDPRRIITAASLLAALGLTGCATTSGGGGSSYRRLAARDCMARVMYFESNRSSPDGMIAVGTVVMNRVNSGKYPGSVCGVVGQNNQFADGALRKSMSEGRSKQLAYAMADRVLAGERHPKVGNAMFFHTYGYTFRYNNMHYMVVAGGNAFYEKKKAGTFKPGIPPVTAPVYVAANDTVPPAVLVKRKPVAPVYVARNEPVYRQPVVFAAASASAGAGFTHNAAIDALDRQRLTALLLTDDSGLN